MSFDAERLPEPDRPAGAAEAAEPAGPGAGSPSAPGTVAGAALGTLPAARWKGRKWSLLGRAAAGAAILVGIFATQRIDAGALWETLRRVDPSLLAASAAGFFLLMAAKSWRWSLLVRQAGLRYGFWPSYRSYLAAFALGSLTPGRLGELARAAQLRAEIGAELGPCLRSVVSDRLFDLLFLGCFGPFALWAVMTGRTESMPLAAGFVVLYVVASNAVAGAGKLVGLWRPRWRPLELAVRWLAEVGGDLVGRPGLIGSAVTFLSYAVYFGASLVLLNALGIRLSFWDVACVTGCLSLVLLLPISIAGIGPREATLIALLGKYGVSREDALAYSILQFAVFTLFGGIVGALAILAAGKGAPRHGSGGAVGRHPRAPVLGLEECGERNGRGTASGNPGAGQGSRWDGNACKACRDGQEGTDGTDGTDGNDSNRVHAGLPQESDAGIRNAGVRNTRQRTPHRPQERL